MLTKQNVDFKWDVEQEESFIKLKDITSNSVIGHYNQIAIKVLFTDASPVGIGTVLH